MNQIVEAIRQFFRLFKLWLIVSPWEQAVRVRLGKHVAVLDAGVHLRLPVIDAVFVQSVRLRVSSTDRQTVGSKDGKAVTFAGAVGYEVRDLRKLYSSLHHAEDTIRNMVRSAIAQDVATHFAREIRPVDVQARVSEVLDLSEYGLSKVQIFVTDLVITKTYRLVGDYAAGTFGGTPLQTEFATGSGNGPTP